MKKVGGALQRCLETHQDLVLTTKVNKKTRDNALNILRLDTCMDRIRRVEVVSIQPLEGGCLKFRSSNGGVFRWALELDL